MGVLSVVTLDISVNKNELKRIVKGNANRRLIKDVLLE